MSRKVEGLEIPLPLGFLSSGAEGREQSCEYDAGQPCKHLPVVV